MAARSRHIVDIRRQASTRERSVELRSRSSSHFGMEKAGEGRWRGGEGPFDIIDDEMISDLGPVSPASASLKYGIYKREDGDVIRSDIGVARDPTPVQCTAPDPTKARDPESGTNGEGVMAGRNSKLGLIYRPDRDLEIGYTAKACECQVDNAG